MHGYIINLLEGEAKKFLTPWSEVVILQPADQRQSVEISASPAGLGEAGRGKETRIGEEAIDTAKGLEAIRVVGGGRVAPYEIHGIARVYCAVAAGGDGQGRFARAGGGGRGRRGPRDGQRDRGRAAGIRRKDSRRPSSLDGRRIRPELHRRRGARVRQARCRLPEGPGGRGLARPGRRVLLREPGRGTRGDRPRGRCPRLLANWLRSRGRGSRARGLRSDRGPGNRGGWPCPGEDRAPGTPRRGPPVRQGPGRRPPRHWHRAGHGRSPRGRRFGGPRWPAARRGGKRGGARRGIGDASYPGGRRTEAGRA